jgi:hypothetical protein
MRFDLPGAQKGFLKLETALIAIKEEFMPAAVAKKTKPVSKAGNNAPKDAVRVRGSGAQIVYDKLRKAILELTLEPGSPLDEVGLSE